MRAFSAFQLSSARFRERARGYAVSTLQAAEFLSICEAIRIIRESTSVWRELVSRECNDIDTPSIKPRAYVNQLLRSRRIYRLDCIAKCKCESKTHLIYLLLLLLLNSCVLYSRSYSLLQTICYPRPRTAPSAISEAELPVESPSTFTSEYCMKKVSCNFEKEWHARSCLALNYRFAIVCRP